MLKYLMQCMKLNWKFQGGGRVQTKKPSLEGMDIFRTTFFTPAYLLNMNQLGSSPLAVSLIIIAQ